MALKRIWPNGDFSRSGAVYIDDLGDGENRVFDLGSYRKFYVIVCASYSGNSSIDISMKDSLSANTFRQYPQLTEEEFAEIRKKSFLFWSRGTYNEKNPEMRAEELLRIIWPWRTFRDRDLRHRVTDDRDKILVFRGSNFWITVVIPSDGKDQIFLTASEGVQ